jgi:hypothetical protein
MTPEQVAQVQQSFAKVAPIADKAAALFYDRLFEIAPELRPLFHGDMAEQGRKLMATLAIVVRGLSRLDTRERARQAPRRLRGQERALPAGRRRIAVDIGAGPRRAMDARFGKRLDRRVRDALRLHDQRSLR